MNSIKKFLIALLSPVWFLFAVQAVATPLTVIPVTEDVWAIVGEKEQRSPTNLANNATFGLIVTSEGLVLVDPGGSYQGAEALHKAIQTVSNQPVRFVINTGGQDHRWLGNDYWHHQGATIIASDAAVLDQKKRVSDQLSGLQRFLKGQELSTVPRHADVTFETDYSLTFGGMTLELKHRGAAHTPGDSFVWMPSKQTMFTGDIVYVERILGIGQQSKLTSWISIFEQMASFEPKHIVPGHGSPTNLDVATRDTYQYLANLRANIIALIDEGGDILQAPSVDQSQFSYLEQFESLAGRNAQTAFEQMEWE